VKVIAKDKASKARMAGRLLQERNIVAAFANTDSHATANSCIAHAVSTFTNSKICFLVYDDTFVCDLAAAISSSAIPTDMKAFFVSCMYNAISFVHDNGLMHRLINAASFLITANGNAKVGYYLCMLCGGTVLWLLVFLFVFVLCGCD
jgi:serine/threonine protein kinase